MGSVACWKRHKSANYHAATECLNEMIDMRMKTILFERQSELLVGKPRRKIVTNSSESYLINFFATQTVPYDLLYYNNGIEIRVNDTIFSIFTWVLSYFILVLFIVISTIMYRFFKKHSKKKRCKTKCSHK